MDRFSIIQRQVFNNPVVDEPTSCGQEQCICEDNIVNERQPVKKTDLLQASIITIVALAVAFTMKANMTHENILLAKRAAVISCSSKINDSDNRLPGDSNNKNSCLHQQGSLCETNNSKRKFLKTHIV